MSERIRRELRGLSERGKLKSLLKAEERPQGEICIRGKVVVDLTSWDYLGIRNDKKLLSGFHREVERTGLTVHAPRLVSGGRSEQLSLEERIAQFTGAQAAALFSSRNQATFSLFASLLTEVDSVFIEESVQAPVADAAYLVGATVVPFSFAESDWQRKIAQYCESAPGDTYLFCDTLSPVTGALFRSQDLLALSLKTGAKLVCDDTHSLGALGVRGSGAREILGGAESVPYCAIGSFGWGIPGVGAYVAGPTELIGFLVNRSHTFNVEPAPSPALCALAEAAIDLVELRGEIRTMLVLRAASVALAVRQAQLELVSPSQESPIVSVGFPKAAGANAFESYLFGKGFLVESVPRGTMLSEKRVVRMVIGQQLSGDQVEELNRAILASSKQRLAF